MLICKQVAGTNFRFYARLRVHESQLALGGSMENAVALDEFRVLNPEGLRYDDEFLIRFWMLLVTYLGGHSLIGELRAYKTGHGLNNKLLNAVLAQKECWEFVTYDSQETAPIRYAQPALA